MTDRTAPLLLRPQSYRKGVCLVLLGSACSSWIGLGVRMIEDASAWQILAYRSFGLSVFLLIVIALRNPGRINVVFRSAGLPSLFGGIGLVMAFSGIILAIQKASVANAMFLLAASPFIAAILGRLVLKERVRPATWIAILCAFAGIVVMVAEGISFGFVWGNIAGLAAALGLAVFVVALRWGHLSDMLPVTVIGGVLGVLVAGTMCLISDQSLVLSWHDALWSLALGVFQLGLALILITAGSRSVPAAELALLTLSEVILAPLWVWIVLGETAGFFTLIGGALVLAAIVGDTASGLSRSRPHP